MTVDGGGDALLRTAVSAVRPDELLRFLERQRGFGAKGASPTDARVVDVIPLPWAAVDGAYGIARVVVRDAGTDREYQLPLGLRKETAMRSAGGGVIATIADAGRSFT